jgi:hypothetical protein
LTLRPLGQSGYLHLAASQSRVLLSDIVDRFSGIPWGWKPEWETVLLIARLFMAGEIKLMLEGSELDPGSAVEPLTKPARFKQVSILKRKTADAAAVTHARELYKDLFSKLGREEEDNLVADYRARLTDWQADLKSYALSAATPHHPGKAELDAALARIAQQLAVRDSFAFIESLVLGKDTWLTAADDIHDLVNFYKTQITAWRKLLEGLQGFEINREALSKVPEAASAMAELNQLRDNPKPYGQVNRIEPLLRAVGAVNERLAQEIRERALISIDAKIGEVQAKLEKTNAEPDLCNKALRALQDVKTRVAGLTGIAQIMLLQGQAGEAMDDAVNLIETTFAKSAHQAAMPGTTSNAAQTGQPSVPPPAVKTTRVIRAADFSSKTYLETEADVDAYVRKLEAELRAAIRAGQMARIQ